MLEEDIGPEGAVGGGGRDLCCRHIHALEVVPGSAVGLHCLGHGIQEVSHVDTAKGLSAPDSHPEQVYLHA